MIRSTFANKTGYRNSIRIGGFVISRYLDISAERTRTALSGYDELWMTENAPHWENNEAMKDTRNPTSELHNVLPR